MKQFYLREIRSTVYFGNVPYFLLGPKAVSRADDPAIAHANKSANYNCTVICIAHYRRENVNAQKAIYRNHLAVTFIPFHQGDAILLPPEIGTTA